MPHEAERTLVLTCTRMPDGRMRPFTVGSGLCERSSCARCGLPVTRWRSRVASSTVGVWLHEDHENRRHGHAAEPLVTT